MSDPKSAGLSAMLTRGLLHLSAQGQAARRQRQLQAAMSHPRLPGWASCWRATQPGEWRRLSRVRLVTAKGGQR
jgi:hypothetical protein